VGLLILDFKLLMLDFGWLGRCAAMWNFGFWIGDLSHDLTMMFAFIQNLKSRIQN